MIRMLPHVIFNTSITLGGRYARDGYPFFHNRHDEERVRRLRNSVDAIMVGVGVIQLYDYEFLMQGVGGVAPVLVIVDDNAEISADAKIPTQSDVIIAISGSTRRARLAKLSKRENIEVLTCGSYKVDIPALLTELVRQGVKSVLVEGCGDLPRRMFDQECIDEVYVAISPILTGFGHDIFDKGIKKKIRLRLRGVLHYGDYVVLHYLVR